MPCCTNLRRKNAARAPVESLPLCCVSSDPQMLLSSHDSSQRVLLSLRPRTRDLGGGRVRTPILQDVCQPRTGVTDDSFSVFPSRLALNKVTACAFYMLREQIQCILQLLFSFSVFIYPAKKKAAAYLLHIHTVPY